MAIVQGQELNVGDSFRYPYTTEGQMYTVKRFKVLGNGRTVIIYETTDSTGSIQKGEIYLNVLELMGIEIQAKVK
jgi:hypothetical protein